ncbi:hypothetical protein LLG46_07570 [bacterium]|nr:hypothetical protein [bacterium]
MNVVIEDQGRLIPVEVKSAATPRSAMASGLQSLMVDYADMTEKGWLIHMGNTMLPVAPGILAVQYSEL